MKLKNLNVQLKSLDEAGTGTVRFATLNTIDKDGDVTLPGAFGNQTVKILPAHNWGSVPLGKAQIYEAGDEALADIKMNLDSPTGREWYSALKFDLQNGQPIQEWSYGFSISEAESGEFEGSQVQFLKALKVHELSPVVVGAGEGTATLAMKHLNSGLRLSDEVDNLLGNAEAIQGRLTELKALREKQGKSLNEHRVNEIKTLVSTLQEIEAAIKSLAALMEEEGNEISASSLLAEFEYNRTRFSVE